MFIQKIIILPQKIAKDIAAGAVLIASGFAVIIGILLFHDINAYIKNV